ncbi:unnamed protein product [Gongylonema pulchrum]|uniref:I/LWEQ domain-containing protein n=1 Tax=Gongylonema pulchrum TaxID=637853 RepID=A0A183ELJ9_9BILA|nr:unnamed protein product [Gongylonema pulchrum]
MLSVGTRFQECQVHPQAAESQVALRSAAEKLVTVTSEATSEEQSKRTMEHLEQAAKQAAAAATQTIAAANACQPYLQSRSVTETLIIECTETAERVPPLIASIRESQAARSQIFFLCNFALLMFKWFVLERIIARFRICLYLFSSHQKRPYNLFAWLAC